MRSALPKTLWALWLQGWSKAPPVVQTCVQTWRRHNPGWKLNLLSADNLREFVHLERCFPGLLDRGLPPEALSDVIRIALLREHGGVWLDSTVYCNQPLDSWLGGVMPRGFFAFSRPGPDRMVSSWFLAAHRGNATVTEWYRRTEVYWHAHTERHHYFWFHYLFGEAYEADASFRDDWDVTPKISADGPHFFVPQEIKLLAPVTPDLEQTVDWCGAPVFKLTHKLPSPIAPPGSVLEWLQTRARPRRIERVTRLLRRWG